MTAAIALLFAARTIEPTPVQDPSQVPGQVLPQTPPKAPPPRVQDLSVPPAIPLPAPDSANPDVSTRPITASEAARIALRLQPSITSAQGALATQHGRTRQVQAGLEPQVLVAAGYDSARSLSGGGFAPVEAPNIAGAPGVSPVFTYTGAAQVRQLLFDFNQTRNLVRQSRSLEEQLGANLTRAQQSVVLAVKADFYAYASARRLVTVNEQNVANRQRQLDLANARLRYEIGLPSDVVTAETSKSQGILALNQARDSAEQARITLLTDMGVNPLTPVVALDDSEPVVPDEDARALLAQALRTRPEILAAEREVLASKYGLEAAKSLNLPAIFATLSTGVAGDQFPLKDNSVAFGLGFSVPIEDGGQRSGAIQSAKGQITTAQADLTSAVLTVRSEVTSAFMALKSADQRIAIAASEVANAREGVRVAEGRYSAGLGSFLDITTAQSLLLGALTDQENAVNSQNQTRARLRHATGNALG